MADFVGAVDQGTTSTRFMVFDHDGNEVGRHQLEHEQILPRAGWVEHDPLEIWERTQTVIGVASRSAGLPGDRPRRARHHQPARDDGRLGPAAPAARSTTPSSGRTPAPTRSPRRWTPTGAATSSGSKAGLPPATYFSAGKVQWMLEHVDGLREAAERGDALFGTTDTVGRLEPHRRPRRRRARHRRHQRQPHHADGPADARLGRRAARLLRHPPLDAADDPPSSATPRLYGQTTARRPLGAEIPIAGALGDQQAATVGQVCFAPGEAKNTYGTGNFLLLNTGEELVRSTNGLLTTVAYQFGDAKPVYALEGSIAVTGSAVQWLRDQLGIISGAAEVETLAAQVEDTGGVYFVPAFSGLFAPYWRSDARGAIVGLSRFNTNAHLARATLEAICYQTRDVVDAMAKDSGVRAGLPQGRRRRHGEPPLHAAAGRRPRRPGLQAGGRRDHRPGRRLRCRSGDRVLVGHRRAARQLARGRALGAAVDRRPARQGVCRLAEGRATHPGLGGRGLRGRASA